jgi:hypothetical protein
VKEDEPEEGPGKTGRETTMEEAVVVITET